MNSGSQVGRSARLVSLRELRGHNAALLFEIGAAGSTKLRRRRRFGSPSGDQEISRAVTNAERIREKLE